MKSLLFLLKKHTVVYFIFVAAVLLCADISISFLGIGLLVGSFFEYFLHRGIFHAFPKLLGSSFSKDFKRLISHGHVFHHKLPSTQNNLLIPLWMSACIFVILSLPILPFVSSYGELLSHQAGFVSVYAFYEFIHFSCHHEPIKNRYIAFMHRWHLKHHSENPRARFGVTSPIWDYILGTWR